jgi:hypothetical protein
MKTMDITHEIKIVLAKRRINRKRWRRLLDQAHSEIVALREKAGIPAPEIGGNCLWKHSNETIWEAFIKAVEVFEGLDSGDIVGKVRTFRISRPRHLVCYVWREAMREPVAQIALRLGKRDHTTVVYALKSMEGLEGFDQHATAKMNRYREILNDLIQR